MNSGSYNKLITFNTLGDPPVTVDKDNKEVPNLVEYKTVWAAKEGLSDREFYQAAAMNSESNVTFRMRYVTWIDINMIIICEGKNYQIVGEPIDKTGKRQELFIHAKLVEQR